jgi:hypothetical protein
MTAIYLQDNIVTKTLDLVKKYLYFEHFLELKYIALLNMS